MLETGGRRVRSKRDEGIELIEFEVGWICMGRRWTESSNEAMADTVNVGCEKKTSIY